MSADSCPPCSEPDRRFSPETIPFFYWIFAQIRRDDPVGDLARDWQSWRLPRRRGDTLSWFLERFQAAGAPEIRLEALRRAWSEWSTAYPDYRPTEPVEADMAPEPGIPQGEGYIYVLRSAHGYKIGRSRNLERRVGTIGLVLPFEVELVFSARVQAMKEAERFVHDQFRRKRIRGEWFRLTDDDVEQIERWYRDGVFW